MYTSGTSGIPKGVMLTHHNAISTLRNVTFTVDLRAGCSYLSFLPLAHIFETLLEFMALVGGVRVGYYSGEIKGLSADILALRPEYFAAVPRVLGSFLFSVCLFWSKLRGFGVFCFENVLSFQVFLLTFAVIVVLLHFI